MTIERVAGGTKIFNQLRDLDASTQVTVSCVCAAIVTIGATIGAQAFRDRAPRLTVIEAPVNVVLVLTAIAFILLPLPSDTAALVFVLLVGSVMAIGAAAGDGRLVRTAGFSGVFFIAFKLAFFLVGKQVSIVVAVVVGIALFIAGFVGVSALATALKARRAKPGM